MFGMNAMFEHDWCSSYQWILPSLVLLVWNSLHC